MDVVATTIVEETGKIILACGLSCCLSSVADAVITESETAVDVAETVVCGLSYCLSAVADAAMAVADTAMTVACGSSYYSSAAVDSAMVVVDVGAAVDAAVATTAASSHLSKCSVDFL